MRKLITALLLVIIGAAGGVIGWLEWQKDPTLESLLGENQNLRQALANLNAEEQVGYAKVLHQERREGRLFTQLLLVQTDPRDRAVKLSEDVYQIEGDVAHFDALIIKFDPSLVESGKQGALFLWRRVYGEYQSPNEGFPVTPAGNVPVRYARLMERLGPPEQALFWDAVWQLAHDPEALQDLGVTATYGNAVYTRMRPGLIYALKANASGQVWPEVYPDL